MIDAPSVSQTSYPALTRKQGPVRDLAAAYQAAAPAPGRAAAAAPPLDPAAVAALVRDLRHRCLVPKADLPGLWQRIARYKKAVAEAAAGAEGVDAAKINRHAVYVLYAEPGAEEAEILTTEEARRRGARLAKDGRSLHFAVGTEPGREPDGVTIAKTASTLRAMAGPALLDFAKEHGGPVGLLFINPTGVWDEPDACKGKEKPAGFEESFPIWLAFLKDLVVDFGFDVSVHSCASRDELPKDFLGSLGYQRVSLRDVVDEETAGSASLGRASARVYRHPDGRLFVTAPHDSWPAYRGEDRDVTEQVDKSLLLKARGAVASEVVALPPSLRPHLVQPDAAAERSAAYALLASHKPLVRKVAVAAGAKRVPLLRALVAARLPPVTARILAREMAFQASSIYPTYLHLKQTVTRRVLAAATGAGVKAAREALDGPVTSGADVAALQRALAAAEAEERRALATLVAAPCVPDGPTGARITLKVLLTYHAGERLREWDRLPIPEGPAGDAEAEALLFKAARHLNHLRSCSRGGTSSTKRRRLMLATDGVSANKLEQDCRKGGFVAGRRCLKPLVDAAGDDGALVAALSGIGEGQQGEALLRCLRGMGGAGGLLVAAATVVAAEDPAALEDITGLVDAVISFGRAVNGPKSGACGGWWGWRL